MQLSLHYWSIKKEYPQYKLNKITSEINVDLSELQWVLGSNPQWVYTLGLYIFMITNYDEGHNN